MRRFSRRLSAALRELRARGAAHGIEILYSIRYGDAALQQELATLPLAAFGATTPDDTNAYYSQKAQLFMMRGEASTVRAVVDSGFRVAASQVARYSANSNFAVSWSRQVAWYAAARGDRPAAMVALQQAAADPLLPGRPGGLWAAWHACYSAEVYGLLDDADALLPLLRRCFTLPNGYHRVQLGEPAFARVREDPRVRAFAAELAAAEARARATPVPDAR